MASNRNPFIGSDEGETNRGVRNVIEFIARHNLEGEETDDIRDGRRLILISSPVTLA